MHLLLIHQAFVAPREAGGTRHYELARPFVQAGHTCTIVASDISYLTGQRLTASARLIEKQSMDGITVFRAYTYPTLHRSFVWRIVSFLSFMVTSIGAALKAGPVEVVMGTSPPIFQAGISLGCFGLAEVAFPVGNTRSVARVWYRDGNPEKSVAGRSLSMAGRLPLRACYPYPGEFPGAIDHLPRISHDAVIIGIGDNQTRAHLFDLLSPQSDVMNAIHPSAVIAPDVYLGKGIMVCAGAVVNTGTVLGDNVILNTSCSVDHHNQVGSHAHIAPGSHLGGNVHIGTGAFVGIGSAVIPERTVGDWAVVGAGSSVITDIPPRTTAVGVPAKIVKRRTEFL